MRRPLATALVLLPAILTSSAFPADADLAGRAPATILDTAPAVHHDWDDLRVGDVIASGVHQANAAGVDGCAVPHRVSVGVRLPADTPVGHGKGLSTRMDADCRVVVSAKSLLSGPDETHSPEAARLAQALGHRVLRVLPIEATVTPTVAAQPA